MIIKIDDTYHIDRDEYNYTLKEFKGTVNKKGEPVYVIRGYFSQLHKALEHLAHLKVQYSADEVTIGKYITMLQNERHALKKLLNGADLDE